MAAFLAAVRTPSIASAQPAASAARAAAPAGNLEATPAALHVFLGPDGNACGITLPFPAPKAKAARKPGLIVWLHGGMRGQNREKGLEAHRALLPFVPSSAYYLCSPSAFGGMEWTTPQGIAHIDALIDYMAARYAFDSRDINLVGVSDGNLGIIAYSSQGKREINRRILISSAPQLVLPLESLSHQVRFRTGSWDFLQGGRDRLFPPDQVMPYLQQWQSLYPNAHLHFYPEGEHDFSFYSENAAPLLKSLLSRKSPVPASPVRPSGPEKSPGIQKTAPGS